MQPQPPQQGQKRSFLEKLEIISGLATFPALTLAVVLRRDVGYRMLNPLALAGVAAVMFLFASMSYPANRPQDLQVFAALVLALGFFQRYLRWLELNRGQRQHSRYIGTSCFQAPFIPQYFRSERRLERFFDPAFSLAAGVLLLPYSPALARWIIFAALCLRLAEFAAYRKLLHERLDMVDGFAIGEFQGQTVENFSEALATPAQPQARQSLPTGLGADVRRNLERTKPRQAPAPAPVSKPGIASLFREKPRLTRGAVVLAFLIAIVADGSQFLLQHVIGQVADNGIASFFMPQLSPRIQSLEFAVDCIAMVAAVLLLGFHWALLPSVVIQFVPGLPRIPTWTGCVAFVVWSRSREKATSQPVSDERATAIAEEEATTPEFRLKRITDMHRRRLLTDEEFQAKRREILDEL